MKDDVRLVIDGCLSGDKSVWSAFFHEYAPIAMNLLNVRAGGLSLDQKEDIVQNTFAKLIRGGLRNFRGSTWYEFLAYFRRIVENESRSYLRSGREWSGAVSLDYDMGREEQAFLVRDGSPEPYAGATRNEQLAKIGSLLDGLPLQARQVVLMKMEGYKDREIADILGIASGTVASRYARIRERIKGMFDE
jgi:RNA polymerase sigma factor (sigma-70 family)